MRRISRNFLGRHRRWLLVLLIPAVTVVAIAYATAFLIDEPLRRYTEAKMNAALTGYSVRVERLDFHPLGFSLDLRNTRVVQNAHPDPPVAHIPYLHASVHWRALLSRRVVGDIVIDRPTVNVNLTQARKEIADRISPQERGWQRALEAIYPLKINELRVQEGDLTYVDQGPFEPLHIRHLNFRATNIRNVKSAERFYPSDFQLTAAVFDTGWVSATGQADFLAEPHAAVRAAIELGGIKLGYFKPVTRRYNLAVDQGLLSGTGHVELAPHVKIVELREAGVERARLEYVHSPHTTTVEKETARQVARTARQVSNEPSLLLRIDTLRIVRSTFALVNEAATPGYRVVLTDTDMTLTNLSNHRTEGTAAVRLRGKFMGSGATAADAVFRPERTGPALQLAVRIEDTSMPTMNDLLRAYGNFDVVEGRFSFYSELSVKDGGISGYVKPLFKDLTVYDPDQDRDKPFFRKIYEGLVGGAAKILKNRRRGEVATRADISGPLDNPRMSQIEIIGRLIQNALFKAILPGFEEEARVNARRSPTQPPPPGKISGAAGSGSGREG